MFRGKLVERPTLPDIAVAACRRIEAFLSAEQTVAWSALKREVIELSRLVTTTPWEGVRLDLHRYSARQQAEIDLHGVTGSLDLPTGPGALWPLLAAAQWLHLGKGTVMGLGQLMIVPHDAAP
jgi:DNA-nicking Smr family endonuclease